MELTVQAPQWAQHYLSDGLSRNYLLNNKTYTLSN